MISERAKCAFGDSHFLPAPPHGRDADQGWGLMARRIAVDDYRHLLLPGVPADYLDTRVVSDENRELLARREVMLTILRDRTPLPTTEAREGYAGDRHIEFWLSGYSDMRKVVAATGLDRNPAARLLDFGGASGRVVRHVRTWCQDAELYLCDINPLNVGLTRALFGNSVRAFHNHGVPSLPFPDGWFDCVVAFSVFTHIDTDDTAWLLELRRIVKRGGYLYLTVHDSATWEGILPNTWFGDFCLGDEQFRSYHRENPTLHGRVTHCHDFFNVFVGLDYIEKHWAPLFSGLSIAPLAHEHQTGLVFRVG
jgi:SAM-dependent methyltransferase